MHFVQQVMEDRKTSQGASKMDYLKAMNVETCLNGGFNLVKHVDWQKITGKPSIGAAEVESYIVLYMSTFRDLITKRITVASLVHKCQLVVSVQK